MLPICCHLYHQLPLTASLLLLPPSFSGHNEDVTNASLSCFELLIYSCCTKLPVRTDTEGELTASLLQETQQMERKVCCVSEAEVEKWGLASENAKD